MRVNQRTPAYLRPHFHPQRTHDSLDWNFFLQLWYLLGVGDWMLFARCRAVVKKKKKRVGKKGGIKSVKSVEKGVFFNGLFTKS